VVAVLSILLGTGLLIGCSTAGGGDGEGDKSGPGSCLDFVPITAPSPGNLAARKGAGSTCDLLEVELIITDVTDVFEVNFSITLDSSVAAFDSIDTSTSFLRDDGTDLAVIQNPVIGITRLGSTGMDATGSKELVKLYFSRNLLSGVSNLNFNATQVFGSETPPTEKNGITWTGGAIAATIS